MVDLRGYRLTFDEEFNVLSISQTGNGTTYADIRSEWRFDASSDIGFGRSSFVDPSSGYEPFSLKNGELSITAVPDRTPSGYPGSWESGLITTQGNFSQTYGYFEMRADLSNDPNAWDAFWLLPNQQSAQANSVNGHQELDIVEHYGNNDKGVYSTIHTTDPQNGIPWQVNRQVYSEMTNPSGYHIYGVNWQIDKISFYVDGQLTGSQDTPSDLHSPMYLIANLAVRSEGTATGNPITSNIDYIRIYSNSADAIAVPQDRVSSPDGYDPGLYGADAATSGSVGKPGSTTGVGSSEVLFQSGGSLVSWALQGGSVAATTNFGNVGSYAAKATGDLNGDGTHDILFQDPNGSVVSWTMHDGQPVTTAALGQAGSYSVVGIGDFNGDGTDDVLFRNAAGSIVKWDMQNGHVAASDEIGRAGAYNVVGVGDFNGDGTSDILLQNGATVVEWLMKSGHIAEGRLVGSAGDYRVAGVGDLNEDGTSDVVLQSGSSVVEWLVASGRITAGAPLADAGGYRVATVGDYTGDGTADVLLKAGDGSVVSWTVHDGHVTEGHLLGAAGSYSIIG